MEPSEIPLSMNTESVVDGHKERWTKSHSLSELSLYIQYVRILDCTWRLRVLNAPLLLVTSLLTEREELREVGLKAEVVATVTDSFLGFWVAVRLQSAEQVEGSKDKENTYHWTH